MLMLFFIGSNMRYYFREEKTIHALLGQKRIIKRSFVPTSCQNLKDILNSTIITFEKRVSYVKYYKLLNLFHIEKGN